MSILKVTDCNRVDSELHVQLFSQRGTYPIVPMVSPWKKDSEISEDICLLFDKLYLQRCGRYFGNEMIGSNGNG